MTSSNARIASAIFISYMLAGHAAFGANPSPQDFATARELYKQGKDLRAAGDLHGAYEKLKAAHALGHTPITGVELARTEIALGLFLEARETCIGVARLPVEPDETDRSAEARTDAAKLAEDLRPRLATLRIRVTSSSVSSGVPAIVTVDGETVPQVSLDEPRLVNPGHHVVVAHVEGGKETSSAVDIAEGASLDVSLAPPSAPIEVAHHEDDHTRAKSSGGLGGVTIAGIAIASAGLVVGTIGGIVAMSSNVNLSECPNYQCPQQAWDTLKDARNAALVSTLSFAVAGGGIVLLIVGLVTHTPVGSSSMRGVRILPDLAFDHIGVTGAF